MGRLGKTTLPARPGSHRAVRGRGLDPALLEHLLTAQQDTQAQDTGTLGEVPGGHVCLRLASLEQPCRASRS